MNCLALCRSRSSSSMAVEGSSKPYGGLSKRLIWGTLTSVLGCLLPTGHSLGVINTPEKVIRSWIVSGCEERGWAITADMEVMLWATVVSIFVLGAAIGSMLAPGMADRIGRKGALLLTEVLAAVSGALFLSCYGVNYVEILVLGRFIAGISAGFATCVVSLYLSEICPRSLKGVFSAMVHLGFTVGMLGSHIVGLPQMLGNERYWPLLLSGNLIYVLLGLLALPMAPESPAYYYMTLQDKDRASAELMKLRQAGSSDEIMTELSLLRVEAKRRQQQGSWTLAQIWQDRKLRKLLVFVFLINLGKQFSGINAVFYYSMLVFRSAGLDETQSILATLGAYLANVFMAVLALPLLRYFKRRLLLSISMAGVLLCNVALVAALSVVAQSNLTPMDPATTQTTMSDWDQLQTIVMAPNTRHTPPNTTISPVVKESAANKSNTFRENNHNTVHFFPNDNLINNQPESLPMDSFLSATENVIRNYSLYDYQQLKTVSTYSPNSIWRSQEDSKPQSFPYKEDNGQSDTENERDGNELSTEPSGEDYTPSAEGKVAGSVAIVAIVTFVLFYGAGLGPIPYCYAPETFPCGPRSLAVSVGGAANWGSNFAVVLLFPVLQQHLLHYSFLVFVFMTAVLLSLVVWKLPEPNDTSMDEGPTPIEHSFRGSDRSTEQSYAQEENELMPCAVTV